MLSARHRSALGLVLAVSRCCALSPDVSRRVVVDCVVSQVPAALVAATGFMGAAEPALAASLSEPEFRGLDQQPNERVGKFTTLADGTKFAEIKEGAGDAAVDGSRVSLQWVLRRSNGYFVDSSSVDQGTPFVFTLGDGTAVKGVDAAVRGMKTGGIRRVLVPPSSAYVQGVANGKPGPLPVGYGPKRQVTRVMEIRADVPGEYFFFELEATRVRPPAAANR